MTSNRLSTQSGFLVAVLGAFAFLSRTYISGDTVAVINGSEALLRCLEGGLRTGCEGANQFGLPQYLISLVARQRWGDNSQSLGVLAWTNGLALILYLIGVRRLVLTGKISPVTFLALIVSPTLVYGSSTFSEMLVVTAVVYWLISVDELRPALSIVCAIVLFSSRDSILIMVAPALIVYLYVLDVGRRKLAVAGITIGTSVLLAFNTLKFGSITNPHYSDPALRTYDLGNVLNSASGLVFSPSGGLLTSWPLIFFALIRVVRTPGRIQLPIDVGRFKGVFERQALAMCAGLSIGIQILSLSLWYAPFGWVAWGPRTLLPSMTMTLLLVAQAGASDSLLLNTGRKRMEPLHQLRFLAFAWAAVSSLSAMLLIGYMLGGPRLIGEFVSPREPCLNTPIIQNDPEYYYSCLRAATWRWSGSQTQLVLTEVGVFGVAVAGGLFVVMYLMLKRTHKC